MYGMSHVCNYEPWLAQYALTLCHSREEMTAQVLRAEISLLSCCDSNQYLFIISQCAQVCCKCLDLKVEMCHDLSTADTDSIGSKGI